MNKVFLTLGLLVVFSTPSFAQDTDLKKAIKNMDEIGQEQRSEEWFKKAEKAKKEVKLALAKARKAPDTANNQGHVTSYFFMPEDVYAIYTKPLNVTDIVLEPGEEIAGEVHIGDTSRWAISLGTTGAGPTLRQHIYIKPRQDRLLTNLIIPTNKRTYMVELSSTKTFYMPSVTWDYPTPIKGLNKIKKKKSVKPVAVASVTPENLYFDYKMRRKDRKKSWKPLQIFDDGQKTYIVFSQKLKHQDTPVIYGRTDSGDLSIVNFRVNMPYYVVDGLMNEIVLKRGHKSKDEIKITRDSEIG